MSDTPVGHCETDPEPRLSRWGPTLAMVGIVTLARLAYLAWVCPYALIEDEAHYWEWSRHLDWSYYSKGPGIAWAIAASTRLFGDSEFAVRVPAVLAAAVGALAVAGLAREAMGEKRAGFYAAACFLLSPIYQFNAVLMTIDMPYLAAWAVACWAGWRGFGGEGTEARRHGGTKGGRAGRAWLVLGLAVGVGFLFKYTILLLVPGLVAFGWMEWRRGRRWPRMMVGMGVGVALLGLLPVVTWNARNGWPTVHHLFGHLGLASGDIPLKVRAGAGWRYEPGWTLEFVGIQAVILGPVMYLGLVGLVRAMRGRESSQLKGAQLKFGTAEVESEAGRGVRRGAVYLLCCGLPIALFYLGVTLFTEVEGNWASAAYVTLLPLAGWAAVKGLETPGRNAGRSLWRASVVVGALAAGLSLRLDWVSASAPMEWLNRGLVRLGMKDERPLVPAGRLLAAPMVARDAEALARELGERTGREPFYIVEHYGRASLLAFYIEGHPTVYCSSSLMDEGRRTQYDYWAETDLRSAAVQARLEGRPAVCLGKTRERWEEAFERVEEVGKLAHEPKKDRLAFLGYGYRGFGYRERMGADALKR